MAESFKFREWERHASTESRIDGMATLMKTASPPGRKQLAVFTAGILPKQRKELFIQTPHCARRGKSHLALGKRLSLLAFFNIIFKLSSEKC